MRKPDRAKKPIQFFCATLPWNQLSSYPDIGDWKTNQDGSPAFIASADTGNDISNMAILLHEQIEAFFSWLHGITEEEVSRFDQNWFKEEAEGVKHIYEEPGNDPASPYHVWHVLATKFEREFIEQAGMTWKQHEENCDL